jgi:hypothetical protein
VFYRKVSVLEHELGVYIIMLTSFVSIDLNERLNNGP